MPNLDSKTPLVLFIGGHDPSGGAGLQADLETAAALGCRGASLVTCLTAQDSHNVVAIYPQAVQHLQRQAQTLLADMRPDIVKIGLLGDAAIASAAAELLQSLRVPLVLDPVLAAGGGTPLASDALLQVIREQLLPLTTLLTPNRAEARRLAQLENADEAAQALLQQGCEAVLLTGADEAESAQVLNRLYRPQSREDFHWPLLPQVYHGSGCTLASACACELALCRPLAEAAALAQQFTWQALHSAERVGSGQWFPNRRSHT